MHAIKKWVFILILSVTAATGCAQSYYFRSYQVNDGLSGNTITSIIQDNKGFVWFGTRNGLNRFDGTVFRQFRNEAADLHSIGSNSILCLSEDAQGNLWVGTHDGIYIYDPSHEQFQLFNQIPQSEVRYIFRDKENNMWFISGNELYRYDILHSILKSYKNQGGQATALTISPDGAVWYASLTGVAKKYDSRKDSFTEYNLASLHKSSPVFIQTLCPVSDSTILIATLKQTFLLNTNTLRLKNIFQRHPWSENIQVHKIFRQTPNVYWLGSENGLYIFDLSTDSVRLIQKRYADPYSINDNVITDIFKDNEGSTWVGTFFGGVNYYSRQLNHFQKYFPIPGSNSLGGNLVHEICSDKYNNLWIGTEDGGLNKMDHLTGRFTHFMPNEGKGSIAYQNVHGLATDGDTLWVGSYEHGLDMLDLRTQKVVRHFEKSGKPGSLASNFIVTIYKTRQNKILVGTWAGLYVYDRRKNNFSLLPYFARQAQSVLEDHEGTLWVASYGDGIYFNNEKTGLKGSLHHNRQDSNSITGNYVNNLFEDSKKNIWICTENGLCRFDFDLQKIIRYNRDPILKGNQVFKMLEDSNGILWISTARGLISLDPAKSLTKVYNTDYGLLSDQFNYNSGYKDKKGHLFFGTVKGMISFNPSSIISNHFVPPLLITSMQVDNMEISFSNNSNRLEKAVPFNTSITLPYDSSSITLQAAVLSFTMPSMNEYLYKMEGLDKEWVHIKNNRKINYTKMPPGDYVFKIKGASAGEVWNNKETLLAIHILPPYWASSWAYFFYILAFVGILLTILRYYYIALREKNKRRIKTLEIQKEREIYSAKIEFFTNITHEIRTPLTLIRLPVEKLLKLTMGNLILNEQLTMINKNTDRLIHLTDQLLDFRKAEADNYTLNFIKTDINELLKELFSIYRPMAEEKQLSFRLEIPRSSLMAYVDPEAIRKIFSNLFSNAIKYAEKAVWVKLYPFNSEDALFHIEFKNDGIQIPTDQKEKIFEPFFRLKQTEKYAGTGIGLSLSRSLTELHKGTLSFKPSPDRYNSFFLSIPFHQQHEMDLEQYEVIPAGANPILIEESREKNLHPDLLSILIVEDNTEIAGFLQKELQTRFNVYKAFNGMEALEILSKENIQLIISDIMMPVMDGIELCRKIKTEIQYSHIPVIILTAKNTLQSKIEGLETGADAYIEKPFVFEHLMAQVNNLLHNRNIVREFYAHSPLAHIKGMALTKADKGFLEELQRVIDANITNKDLDVDTLAKMMNMSRPTFYRKIKGLSNLSPNELITISRLKKAAELMSEGKYKITEVASIVGYHLNSNFSRDFNKQFGMSPSGYIKSQIEKSH
jgi:signal transduction histidine kinase/ligand-binding sensor domain-containing protein/DNA-binding response OmpR family regulator